MSDGLHTDLIKKRKKENRLNDAKLQSINGFQRL